MHAYVSNSGTGTAAPRTTGALQVYDIEKATKSNTGGQTNSRVGLGHCTVKLKLLQQSKTEAANIHICES